jgi:23S rRNA (cytosine1962-C5)-methyltransferase
VTLAKKNAAIKTREVFTRDIRPPIFFKKNVLTHQIIPRGEKLIKPPPSAKLFRPTLYLPVARDCYSWAMTTIKKSIVLKPGKEKALLNRHPWIFSGALKKQDHALEVGDKIAIRDHRGVILALGHWCGGEGLVCRVFSFDVDEKIDDEFWLTRLREALAVRKTFGLPSKTTNGFRLVHGEGDGLSGLVLDVYDENASIQLSNPGLAAHMPLLMDFLQKECGQKRIFYHASFNDESTWLVGTGGISQFRENDLGFHVSIDEGQKTGHFLDQRDNRALVRSLAGGRDVLDAFSYTGGFSVYAAAGGARSVTSLDISKQALAMAADNISLNNFAHSHRIIEADCFNYLRTLTKDEYDLIILDPPAFAKSAQAVMRASRGYKDINLVAMKAIKNGGLIFTFSCSQHIDQDLFKKIIFAAAKDSRRDVRIVRELTQGADHPVSIYCPQSLYLKGLLLYVS